jgi:8-oxo-dGTP diphosphatase
MFCRFDGLASPPPSVGGMGRVDLLDRMLALLEQHGWFGRIGVLMTEFSPMESAPAFDDVRSVVFLFNPDYTHIVLLHRAAWKRFAPQRWTGIGGRLEEDELAEPARGALRELREETSLTLADLRGWRFVADVLDPGAEVRLVYFTAVFAGEQVPPCTEGTLHWVSLADYPRLDMIENTRAVLDALLADDILHIAQALPLHGVIRRDAAGKVLQPIFFPQSML